jgi:hypothetical protein
MVQYQNWIRSPARQTLTTGDISAPKFVSPLSGFVRGRERITPESDNSYVAPSLELDRSYSLAATVTQ